MYDGSSSSSSSSSAFLDCRIAGAANGAWAGRHEQEASCAEGLKLGSGRRISSASMIVGCACTMPLSDPGRGRGRWRCARRVVALWESLGSSRVVAY
jgi:hypothetical protein